MVQQHQFSLLLLLLFSFCFCHFHIAYAQQQQLKNCAAAGGCTTADDDGADQPEINATTTTNSSNSPPVMSSTPPDINNTGNSSIWYWGARCSGANEVFMECAFPPDCEPTCEEPQPSKYCRQSCAITRCQCRLGYVRARGGECVRYNNCPCPEPEAVCEGGRNKYGECRCQCGRFERCVIPKACGHCSKNKPQEEEPEMYPCDGAMSCGEYLCNYEEQCQYNRTEGFAQCVALVQPLPSNNSTPTPATKNSTSDEHIGDSKGNSWRDYLPQIFGSNGKGNISPQHDGHGENEA